MSTDASERSRPTGAQWTVRRGADELVVVEVGGGIRSYTRGGVDVVAGFGPDEMSVAGRGQQLIPWPNRLRDGRYAFGGTERQLALTEPAKHNASHGLVRWATWDLLDQTSTSITVGQRLHPQPGLGVGARADDDLRAGRRRAHRDDDRAQRRRGRRALRLRRPPVPLDRRHPRRRGRRSRCRRRPTSRPTPTGSCRWRPTRSRGPPTTSAPAARSATSPSTPPSPTSPAAPTAGGRSPSAAWPPAR